MANTIGTVVIELQAGVEKLKADFDASKSIVSKGARDIQKTADVVQGYLAAIGVGAFAGYISSAIEAASRLQDLSVQTGISAQTLSALDFAAQQSGTNIESVAKSLQKMGAHMYDAANGGKESAAAFAALGLSVTDSNGSLKTTDAMMMEVADKIAGMSNETEIGAIALKLFGKSGADMVPLLKEGSDGIQALMQQAADLGLVVSDQTAAAMEALGDKLEAVKISGTGTARQLAANLTPAITVVADMFLEGSKKGGMFYSVIGVLGDGLRILTSIGIGVVAAFKLLGDGLGRLAAAAVQFAQGDFKGAMATIKDTSSMQETIDYYGSKLSAVWAPNAEGAQTFTKALNETTKSQKENNKEAEKAAKLIADVTSKLEGEIAMLRMSAIEAEIYKQQKAAHVDANSAAGRQIAALVTKLATEKQAMADTAAAQAALTKEFDQAGKTMGAVFGALNEQIDALGRTALEQEVYKQQVAAGVVGDELAMQALRSKVELLAWQRGQYEALAVAQKASLDASKAEQDAQDKLIGTIAAAVDAEELRIKTLGMSRAQVEALRLAEMKRHLELLSTAPALQAQHDALQLVIDRQEELVRALQRGDIEDATRKAADESNKAWSKMFDDVQKGLTNALIKGFESGKGAAQSLREYLENYFKAIPIRIVAQVITGGVMGMAGAAANAMGFGGIGSLLGMGGGGGGGMGMLGMLGGAGGALGGFGTGVMSGLSAWGAGGSVAGLLGSGSIFGGGLANGLGLLTGTLGPIALGIGAVAALWDSAFGHGPRNTESTTLNARVGAGGVSGSIDSAWREKGGWFRSDRTGVTSNALGQDLQRALDSTAQGLYRQVAASFETLGMSTGGIASFSKAISVSLTGKDSEDKKAIETALLGYRDGLVGSASGFLAQYRKADEKLFDTLQRLAGIQTLSNQLAPLGGIFTRIAQSSFHARNALVDMAGGLDALATKSADFVANYYSQDEQAGLQAAAIDKALRAVGIDATGLRTKADYRALLESLSPSQSAQINALLSYGSAFAGLADYLDKNGASLGEVARMSPANVPGLGGDAQTSAINNSTSAIREGNAAIVGAVQGLAPAIASIIAGALQGSTQAVQNLNATMQRSASNAELSAAK